VEESRRSIVHRSLERVDESNALQNEAILQVVSEQNIGQHDAPNPTASGPRMAFGAL
jgi:hypothetical protein